MKGNEGQTRKPAGALKKALAFGCAAAMVLAFAPTAAFAALGAALPDFGSVFASLSVDNAPKTVPSDEKGEQTLDVTLDGEAVEFDNNNEASVTMGKFGKLTLKAAVSADSWVATGKVTVASSATSVVKIGNAANNAEVDMTDAGLELAAVADSSQSTITVKAVKTDETDKALGADAVTKTIKVTAVAEPTVPTAAAGNKAYTGAAQELVAGAGATGYTPYTLSSKEGAAKEAKIATADDAGLTAGSAYGTDAGSYSVVATLAPGFAWNGSTDTAQDTAAKEISGITIAKADVALGVKDADGESPVSGSNPTIHVGETADFEITATPDGGSPVEGVKISRVENTESQSPVTASKKDDATITLDASKAKTGDTNPRVLVEIEATDNFNSTRATIQFDIDQEAAIGASSVATSFTTAYDGSRQLFVKAGRKWTVQGIANDDINAASNGEVEVAGKTVTGAYGVDAGDYNVRVTPAPGYKWDTATSPVKVKGKDVYSTAADAAAPADDRTPVNFTFKITKVNTVKMAVATKVGTADYSSEDTSATVSGVNYGDTIDLAVAAKVYTSGGTPAYGSEVANVAYSVSAGTPGVLELEDDHAGTVKAKAVGVGSTTITVTPTADTTNITAVEANAAFTVHVLPLGVVGVDQPSDTNLTATYALDKDGKATTYIMFEKEAGYHCSVVPSEKVSGEYTYGNAQLGTVEGAVSKTTLATYAYGAEAGRYAVTVTPDPGYAWGASSTTLTSSLPTNAVQILLTVNKANVDVTLTPATGSSPADDKKGTTSTSGAPALADLPYGTDATYSVALTESGNTDYTDSIDLGVAAENATTPGSGKEKVVIPSYDESKKQISLKVDSVYNGSNAESNDVIAVKVTGDANHNDATLYFTAAAKQGTVTVDAEGASTNATTGNKELTIDMAASTALSGEGAVSKVIDLDIDPASASASAVASGAAVQNPSVDGKKLTITSAVITGTTQSATVTVTPSVAGTDDADRYNSAAKTLVITVNVTPLANLTDAQKELAEDFKSAVGAVAAVASVDDVSGDNYAELFEAVYGEDGTASAPKDGSAAKAYNSIKGTSGLLAYADSAVELYNKYVTALDAQDKDDTAAATAIAKKCTDIVTAAAAAATSPKGTPTSAADTKAIRDELNALNKHAKALATTGGNATAYSTLVAREAELADAAIKGVEALSATVDALNAAAKSGAEVPAADIQALQDAIDAFDALSEDAQDAAPSGQVAKVDEAKAAIKAYSDKAAIAAEEKALGQIAALDALVDGAASVTDDNADAVKTAIADFDALSDDATVSKGTATKIAAYRAALKDYADAHELTGGTVSFDPAGATYTGADVTPGIAVKSKTGAAVPADAYDAAWTDASGAAVQSLTAAGAYKLTVTAKGAYTGGLEASYTVGEGKLSLTFANVSKTFKGKKLVKKKKLAKKQTFAAAATAGNGAAVSYKVVKSAKGVTFKNGKVTVKKGTKKGTYKLTVQATATLAGYTTANATATITVKVK